MDFKIRLSPRAIFGIFLVFWAILNCLQAVLTPLHSDEAYYWMWSRNLAWGYFDHPPMVALMIRAGYFLIRDELGVRLLTIIIQLASFILLWNLIDGNLRKRHEYVWLLVLLIFTIPMFSIYGFITTPDSPLMFFEVLFLFFYKKFTEENSWRYALLLGLSMAAIMYSKYHGVLLITLVIISDLKLLKNVKFYAAGIFALILFVPHIQWQIANDFPSIKYHLVGRVKNYSLKEVPEYILNTLVIYNPFVLPAIALLLFRRKKSSGFERTLIFISAGIFLFFFLSSFRYHVEPHWTAIMTVPLVILTFNSLADNERIFIYLRRITFFSVFIFLFIRSAFMFDYLPVPILKKQYHDTRQRFLDVERIAGDRPVVFSNSFQNPSRYTWYTGKFSHTLNSLSYRKNQFDLWDYEQLLHGRDVLFIPHYIDDESKKRLEKFPSSRGDTIWGKKLSNFQSLQKECAILENKNFVFSKIKECEISFRIFNPYPYQININHETFPVKFYARFTGKRNSFYAEKLEFKESIGIINPGDTISITGYFSATEIPNGKYRIGIASECGMLFMTYNSRLKEAEVND